MLHSRSSPSWGTKSPLLKSSLLAAMDRSFAKAEELETQCSGGALQAAESSAKTSDVPKPSTAPQLSSAAQPRLIAAPMVPKLKPKAPPGPPPERMRTPAIADAGVVADAIACGHHEKTKKRKQSSEEENARHGGKQCKQFSDEYLDRRIWTAKGTMTWRQFHEKNGCSFSA